MAKKYSIEEFKNYLMAADSYGDAIYFLNEEKIEEANSKNAEDEEE